jgi:hypothetical protein
MASYIRVGFLLRISAVGSNEPKPSSPVVRAGMVSAHHARPEGVARLIQRIEDPVDAIKPCVR